MEAEMRKKKGEQERAVMKVAHPNPEVADKPVRRRFHYFCLIWGSQRPTAGPIRVTTILTLRLNLKLLSIGRTFPSALAVSRTLGVFVIPFSHGITKSIYCLMG